MKFKRAAVKKNERGLLLRSGDFDRMLQPGAHRLFVGLDTQRVEHFALEQPAFAHEPAHYLMAKGTRRGRRRVLRGKLTEHQAGRTKSGALVEAGDDDPLRHHQERSGG